MLTEIDQVVRIVTNTITIGVIVMDRLRIHRDEVNPDPQSRAPADLAEQLRDSG